MDSRQGTNQLPLTFAEGNEQDVLGRRSAYRSKVREVLWFNEQRFYYGQKVVIKYISCEMLRNLFLSRVGSFGERVQNARS